MTTTNVLTFTSSTSLPVNGPGTQNQNNGTINYTLPSYLSHTYNEADRNFKRPSGPRLPTTLLRVTGLMLRPSLGAAWLAWKIWPPVGFCAEPLAVAGPPSQRAAPPAWRPRRPSLQLRTSGPLPARSPVNEIGTYP